MRRIHALLLPAISLFALPAFAAQPTGLYIGPEVATTRLDFDDSSYSKTHTTWGGLVAWQFNQFVSAEFGMYGGKRLSESTTINGAVVDLDLKYSTSMMTVIGQYPINDRYSAFARVGVATAKQDSIGTIGSTSWTYNNVKESRVIYGVGVGATIERARIRLECRRTKIAFADSGAIALSLAWFISNSR
jgi:hypothetical protein